MDTLPLFTDGTVAELIRQIAALHEQAKKPIIQDIVYIATEILSCQQVNRN